MDRSQLHEDAIACLRREVPEHLEWIPWAELPALQWRDDRTPVDARIPKGWLVLAAQRSNPEPDAVLQQAAELFEPAGAVFLGAWMLRAWIEHDTYRDELTEERRRELRAIAEKAAVLAERFGRGGTDPEERYQQMLATEENRPEPSALPHQGLLASVAVCADGTVAPLIETYLSTWHRERPEQCRALLRMLSWIKGSEARDLLSEAMQLPGLQAVTRELLDARTARRVT